MDERYRKSSNNSTDIPSPVLLRRRLSAPETIMRKHILAKQQLISQEGDISQTVEARSYPLTGEVVAGSDPNLNKKRDPGLMRRSTLLRRLWDNGKPVSGLRLSGSFSEWQHSFGKLSSGKSTHSLTSNHSSPEHYSKSQNRRSLNGNDFRISPQHKSTSNPRRISPKHQTKDQPSQNISPRKISSVYKTNFDNNVNSYDTMTENSNYIGSSNSRVSKNVATETELEVYSSRSTTNTTTSFSDNTDSAYVKSNITHSSQNNSLLSIDEVKYSQESTPEQISNYDLNSNFSSTPKNEQDSKYIKYSCLNESSTQTSEITNLNVLSNVHLSQSTLDIIFDQVMQDVKKNIPEPTKTVKNKIEPQTQQQGPSFYLKRKEDITLDNAQHSRIVKYMISNVGTGSPYSKPAEVPQIVVPRFSALPRTSSMEVNTSSGESEDRESDSISLVDSLEDIHTPKYKEQPTKRLVDLSPPLPDNSDKKKNKVPKKPASFFIPIEIDKKAEVGAVSEHLPDRVREKLTKRQQELEEKISSLKSKHIDNYENKKESYAPESNLVADSTSQKFNSRLKRKNKPILPSVESIRRNNAEDKVKEQRVKSLKRKSASKEGSPEVANKTKASNWAQKNKNKTLEKLSPLYRSKNEYVYDSEPRKIYHKAEFSKANKRIEILEIMECVEPVEKNSNQLPKTKSRIPILVHQKLPKISSPTCNKNKKPGFTEFDEVQMSDSKLDELIARILIDTLNNREEESPTTPTAMPSRNFPDKTNGSQSPLKHIPASKYQQKFEVIPEELSLQTSTEECQNINKDKSNNNEQFDTEEKSKLVGSNNDFNGQNRNEAVSSKRRAAVAVVRDENFSTIPKGWITFYMLHKNQGSPDSTSDEGKNQNNAVANPQKCLNGNKKIQVNDTQKDTKVVERNALNTPRSNSSYNAVEKERTCSDFESFSSNSDERKNMHTQGNANGRQKKHFNYGRKNRPRNYSNQENNPYKGEWSVTVSGTNSYTSCAPELELRLKFTNAQKNNNPCQSDSGFGEENQQERKTCFPKIETMTYTNSSSKQRISTASEKLPQIEKNKLMRNIKRSDTSVPIGSLLPTRYHNRSTRASTKRYNLIRSKIRNQRQEIASNRLSLYNERSNMEILRSFPEILTITGRSISPDTKTKIYNISDR